MSRGLTLIRGVSGSGKSELSKLFEGSIIVDLNDALADLGWDGKTYDKGLYEAAYKNMLFFVDYYMLRGKASIVVVAPSLRERDVMLYKNKAERYNYMFFSVVVEYNGKNVRDVPEGVLEYQAESIKESLKLK
jgi:predicted kinase